MDFVKAAATWAVAIGVSVGFLGGLNWFIKRYGVEFFAWVKLKKHGLDTGVEFWIRDKKYEVKCNNGQIKLAEIEALFEIHKKSNRKYESNLISIKENYEDICNKIKHRDPPIQLKENLELIWKNIEVILI